MTAEEFQRARVERERYVFRVLKHKTMDTHGPAQVVLTKLLYSYINVFIKQMRPRLPLALSDVKQALFLSWLGNQIESNQMTEALSSIFKKAGIKGPVHHTLYRKSAVSQCHARHKEISSNLADLMAHREGTAEKYYRLFEKNKLDKESKFCVFTNFPRALVRRDIAGRFFRDSNSFRIIRFMAAAAPTVLILGHSFVKRLKRDLNSGFNRRAARDFRLHGTASVCLHGIGGRTVHSLRAYDLQWSRTWLQML